ncbi:MAG: MFS transporter [Pseudomonadales bacterium]
MATKASYGIGQLAEGIKNGCFNVYLFFFYSAVLGLDPKLVGIALFIALLFDAITDPLAGYLSDNWRSRWGRRHPFILAAAVPMAVSFYLLFSPPEFGQMGLFLWLVVFAVLTRGAMTLYYVPHLSLGAELSPDFHERTTVVAYRYFSSYLGYMVSYGIGFGIFFAASESFANGQFDRAAYSPFAMTLGAIMVLSILVCLAGTYHRIPYLQQPGASMQLGTLRAIPLNLVREIRSALSNRSFAWLFAGILVVFTMVGVDSALNLHMNTYFWELAGTENLAFFIASPVGFLIGAGFVRRCNEWFDKKPCMVIGTAGWALLQIVPVVLRLLEWFPENGSDTLLWTLVCFRFVQGLVVCQALITFNSMVPDIVDEHELHTGKRQEGMFFAATSFSSKATQGLGTFFAGIALWLIGWPGGTEITSAAAVTPEHITWLGLLFGPIVSGFAVLCLYFYSKHDLTRARHAEIVEALAARRARESVAAAGSE